MKNDKNVKCKNRKLCYVHAQYLCRKLFVVLSTKSILRYLSAVFP